MWTKKHTLKKAGWTKSDTDDRWEKRSQWLITRMNAKKVKVAYSLIESKLCMRDIEIAMEEVDKCEGKMNQWLGKKWCSKKHWKQYCWWCDA